MNDTARLAALLDRIVGRHGNQQEGRWEYTAGDGLSASEVFASVLIAAGVHLSPDDGLRAALETLYEAAGGVGLLTYDGERVEPPAEAWHELDDALERAKAALEAPATPPEVPVDIEKALDDLARELGGPLGTDIRVERIRAALPAAFREYRDWGVAAGRAAPAPPPTLDARCLARSITANWKLVRTAFDKGGTPLAMAEAVARSYAAEYARLSGDQQAAEEPE